MSTATKRYKVLGNELLLRSESWGALVSDLRNDRVWGFDQHWEIIVNRLLEQAGADPTPQDSVLDTFSGAISQLRRFSTFDNTAEAVDPWSHDGSFFWGTLPDKAGFSLSGPIGIGWLLTNLCNSHCIYCCADAKRNGCHRLTLEQAKKIVNNLVAGGTLRLNIGGGEPTMFPGWQQLLKHSSDQGLRPVITTNGRVMDSETVAWLAEYCSQVQVSFDTTDPKLHRRLRGDNDWKQVVKGLSLALSGGVRVRVVTVLTRLNQHELTQLARFLWELGVRQWMIFWMFPSGRGVNAYSDLAPVDTGHFRDELKQLPEQFPGLNVYLWGLANMDRVALNIADDGRLVLHDYHSNRRIIVGDLLHEKLDTIWSRFDWPMYEYFLNWVSGSRVTEQPKGQSGDLGECSDLRQMEKEDD